MDTKDYILSTGIVVSIVVSLITLSLGFKNRRNALREHLYKEQISFFSKFLLGVNKLNFEIEGLINISSKRNNNNFYELLETVSFDYYNYEFFIPTEISGLIHNLIFKADGFYLVYVSTDEAKIRTTYSNYFKSYTDMLNHIKDFIGTNELSKENSILHSQSEMPKNRILKLLIEVSQKTGLNSL